MSGITQIMVGDVVRLKSGGPRMTVIEIDESGAYCMYFSRTSKGTRSNDLDDPWEYDMLGTGAVYPDVVPLVALTIIQRYD